MKLLITGDWHLRYKSPELRTDNFFEVQFHKVSKILKQAKKNGCEYILQPGDFFDSVDTSWPVIRAYMKLFIEYNIPIISILGQHDKRYHTRALENTPSGVIEAANIIQIAGKESIMSGNNVHIYGCSWGENLDGIEIVNEDVVNILLIHTMIIDSDKLWESQDDFSYANHLLRKYKFDLIVSGDNHGSFIVENGRKVLINCGSLMRTRIDQKTHNPITYIYSTTQKAVVGSTKLSVKPFKDVFYMDHYNTIKERDKNIGAFVDMLESINANEGRINFVPILYYFIEHNSIEFEIKSVIDESLSEVMK